MDILSHTLSGVAAGTAAATLTSRDWKFKLYLVIIGGMAGALPDIDALSLWSKFDNTFGHWFNLSFSGKEIYFGKLWYSHHAAMHSVVAALVVASIGMFSVRIIDQKRNGKVCLNTLVLTFVTLSCAFMFHLFEDMPTPHCVWGGVNLFWPNSTYVGGFGKIWWWNNYDLFLLICGVIITNSVILLLSQFKLTLPRFSGVATLLIGASLMIGQINSRQHNYNYKGHTIDYVLLENQSKEEQEAILGSSLYSFMEWFDNKIPLNF